MGCKVAKDSICEGSFGAALVKDVVIHMLACAGSSPLKDKMSKS